MDHEFAEGDGTGLEDVLYACITESLMAAPVSTVQWRAWLGEVSQEGKCPLLWKQILGGGIEVHTVDYNTSRFFSIPDLRSAK